MADKIMRTTYGAGAAGADAASADEIFRYEQILARDPSSLVFAALAELYRKRKMPDRAVKVCRRGLQHHPEFVSGRVALARAYADLGEIGRAERELERVVQAAPENLVAQRLLLAIYRKTGERAKLEKTVHRVLSLNPADEEARGLWRRMQESPSMAPERGGNGGGGITTQTLAEIYASQGYHRKAFEIYRRLALRDPENPFYHERLAELKEKLSRRWGQAGGAGEGAVGVRGGVSGGSPRGGGEA